MLLQLHEVNKQFGTRPILQNVSLTIPAGEILSLLGPSGSGKTTLLRILAGLEQADSGSILLEGQELSDLPVHQRGFGYVFQEYALFPHKNVGGNVAFGLRMKQWEKARIEARVQEVLALVGLAGFAERPIHQLSGGEQQRVALARSLAPAPRLLLLDEPLGALDRVLRERLMVELRTILKQVGADITAIYVTHDQGEAFAVADRVAIMNNGRIEQIGAPLELYRRPRTPFVARFLGMDNVLTPVEFQQLPITNPAISNPQSPISLLIRPEAARLLTPNEAKTAANVLEGQLLDVSFRGRYQVATISPHPKSKIQNLKFDFDSSVTLPAVGSPVFLSLDPAQLLLLE
jgi:ABC-type Fe3+/spermidine/putrescine transport system ATPase subunit